MQKALRINLLSRNAALKKAHLEKLAEVKGEWKQWQQAKIDYDRKLRQYAKEERKHRREDWIAGPLAPNRDTGARKGLYGTLDAQVANEPTIPESARASPKSLGSDAPGDPEDGFKGEGMVGNIALNDRVVVVRGDIRIKGKIGTVIQIDPERETVKLSGMNMADVAIPDYAPQFTEKTQKMTSMELGIPMNDVRLVIRMSDPTTNFDKDVVISHIYADGPYRQQPYGRDTPQHTRYISGLDEPIPWPEERSQKDFRRHDCDTARLQLDQETWSPSIYISPLAAPSNLKRESSIVRVTEGIMDELRDKTARDNTRHVDEAYIRRRLLQDARSLWWLEHGKKATQMPAAEKAAIEAQRRRDEEEAGREQNAQYGGVTKETWDIIQQMQAVTLQRTANKRQTTRV